MLEARAGAHVPGTGHPLDPPHDLAPWLPQTRSAHCWSSTCCCAGWVGTRSRCSRGPPWPWSSRCSPAWPRCGAVAPVPVGLLCLLPVIDLGVVGLARLDAQVGGAGVLAVIPALWLGAVLGRRGAVVALVALLVLMVVPGFLYLGTSMPVVTRSLLIPVVAVASALAIAAALEQARSGLAEARRKQVQLAQALATIEDQRRFSDAILDTVDVGLVLLDADGTYRAMNRRHRAFMARGYPDGHAGRAGQLGHVYATADGTTPLVREEMPTYRASQGEEFDDQLLWIGQDPLTNRAVSVSARAVRDEDGTFTGAALAYKDVTDFVRALGSRTSSSPRSPTSCAPR